MEVTVYYKYYTQTLDLGSLKVWIEIHPPKIE